jgi:hypothetical protein
MPSNAVAKLTVTLVEAVNPLDKTEMFAVPVATAVTTPLPVTVATVGVSEVQLADVRLCVEPSVYVPTAVSFWVDPTATVGVEGVMVIEASGTDGVTVRVATVESGTALPPAQP